MALSRGGSRPPARDDLAGVRASVPALLAGRNAPPLWRLAASVPATGRSLRCQSVDRDDARSRGQHRRELCDNDNVAGLCRRDDATLRNAARGDRIAKLPRRRCRPSARLRLPPRFCARRIVDARQLLVRRLRLSIAVKWRFRRARRSECESHRVRSTRISFRRRACPSWPIAEWRR